ncbi:MAG: hypothetical protein H0U74_00070 [Bradymonadaceae bacterium]|nr:hypothetical protein [Lujinxingiaceae bacterium]
MNGVLNADPGDRDGLGARHWVGFVVLFRFREWAKSEVHYGRDEIAKAAPGVVLGAAFSV